MSKIELIETPEEVTVNPGFSDLMSRPVSQHTAFDVLLDNTKHDQIARAAGTFSKAELLPAHWRGKAADIFTILCRAYTLDCDPMMMLEQCFIISGKIGMSAQLAIALANKSGLLKTGIDWQVTGAGDTLSVTAFAILRNGNEIRATVDMAMAKSEKWTNNAKYRTMPEHMLMYRSATWLIRRYMPEVLLGMSTSDELLDVAAAKKETQKAPVPEPTINAEQVKRLNTMMSHLEVDREAMKTTLGIQSFNELLLADHDDAEQIIKDTATPALYERMKNCTTPAELADGLQDAMSWFPAGTKVRNAYSKRMNQLANPPQGEEQ